MCGVAGFIDPEGGNPDAMEQDVRRMTAQLRHRGPDQQATWIDSGAGVALGHARLAIIDLSEHGAQPMHSADGRYVIIYNGEIYNFPELRQHLDGRGWRNHWCGHSDTEVLLATISEYGVFEATRRLNGMFAFALWDRAERKLWLARDPAGEKPLYYGWHGDRLLFGSELKALQASPRWAGEIDREAVALYTRFRYIPQPWSIYRGIRKLPQGHILEISQEHLAARSTGEPKAFWSIEEVAARGRRDPFAGSDDEAVDALEATVSAAVRRRMISDVPLGAFLSGGVDSSTIVALMQAQSDQPVKTFSVGFAEAEFDEAPHARAVAEHLGTAHTEFTVSADQTLGVVPKLPTLYDEPFADSSQIPTYLISALAREHVTVCLSGDAGDELLGGYSRYDWGKEIWRSIGWAPGPVRRAAAGALRAVPEAGWSVLSGILGRSPERRLDKTRAFKTADIIGGGNAAEVYGRLISMGPEGERFKLFPEPLPKTDFERSVGLNLGSIEHMMMYLDFCNYLPDDILTKVDRAAMGVSLETRIPLLDPEVIALCWRMPLHIKRRAGTSKWLLRQVLDRHVPRKLIDRPKMGFGVPVAAWLRGPLREWAESLLNEEAIRGSGLLQADAVRQLWAQHISGEHNREAILWSILMLQAWLAETNAGAGVNEH